MIFCLVTLFLHFIAWTFSGNRLKLPTWRTKGSPLFSPPAPRFLLDQSRKVDPPRVKIEPNKNRDLLSESKREFEPWNSFDLKLSRVHGNSCALWQVWICSNFHLNRWDFKPPAWTCVVWVAERENEQPIYWTDPWCLGGPYAVWTHVQAAVRQQAFTQICPWTIRVNCFRLLWLVNLFYNLTQPNPTCFTNLNVPPVITEGQLLVKNDFLQKDRRGDAHSFFCPKAVAALTRHSFFTRDDRGLVR